jgi:hypothetical protein
VKGETDRDNVLKSVLSEIIVVAEAFWEDQPNLPAEGELVLREPRLFSFPTGQS